MACDPLHPLKEFIIFGENLIRSVLRIPRKIDDKIDGIAIVGDERWMGGMYGEGFVINDV